MSVIFQNEHGFLICSKSYFDGIYDIGSSGNFTDRRIVINKCFFDIRTPFFTDSKAKKYGQTLLSGNINKVDLSFYLDFFLSNL